ncbi:MAG: sensor histidine kinase [Halanaeroarchaeum sp.]
MHPRLWAVAFAALGVFATGWGASHLLTDLRDTRIGHVAVVLLFLVAAGLAILYWSAWLYANPLPAERYPRVAAWMLATGVVFSSVGVVTTYAGSVTLTGGELAEVLGLGSTYGLATGLLLGIYEARLLESREAAARSAALEQEREFLVQLQDVMNHYLLNAVSVIDGRAELLQRETSEDAEASIEAIRDEAAKIETVVEQLEHLTVTFDPETVVVDDLAGVVGEAFDAAEGSESLQNHCSETLPAVEIPENATEALLLLADVLHTLTAAEGSVTIRSERRRDAVEVRFRAAPATLPERVRASLFEPIDADLGLKLYLAHEILDHSGSLSATTGDETVRFAWRVSRAEDGAEPARR